MKHWLVASAFVLAAVITMAQSEPKKTAATPSEESPLANATTADLKKMAARFAPTELKVDVSRLTPGDRKALVLLIQAARILDPLYMEQRWSANLKTLERLKQDTSDLGRARLHYFMINKGPWSDLDENQAFIPAVPAKKPLGANFYPEDASKDELERWINSLDEEQKKEAQGFFTVVRRGPDSKFRLVPFSEEYAGHLKTAYGLLREAAKATTDASLRKFLDLRAEALLTNDYFESDVAWMDLDSPVDVTYGPYETYNDELFGYKAAFEAYINLKDPQESAKLAFFGKHLQDIENNLPIDPKYRNPKIGAMSPIVVVNQVFSSGDGNHGVQTAAYNLPNDERVITLKGSKRVMLKNVQEAKFRSTLVPISRVVLKSEAQADLQFESFFTHILAHELTHGLGPHSISVGGRDTSPRKELKEHYSAMEEAKADVTGLFALQHLMDKGLLKDSLGQGETAERKLYTTFLASAFRTLRFGVKSSHARGMAMQFNYMLDKGAFIAHPDGTFSVDLAKVKQAVRALDRELLTIQATGDYSAAGDMLKRLSVVRPEMQRALDRLKDIPTDIEPIFVTAEQLAPEGAKPAAQAPVRRKR